MPHKRMMLDDDLPEPPDDNDVVWREKQFESYRASGIKPEEFPNLNYRQLYAEWLTKNS